MRVHSNNNDQLCIPPENRFFCDVRIINVSKRLITTWITIRSSEFLNLCLIEYHQLRCKRRCKHRQTKKNTHTHIYDRRGCIAWTRLGDHLKLLIDHTHTLTLSERGFIRIICASMLLVMCQCILHGVCKYANISHSAIRSHTHTYTHWHERSHAYIFGALYKMQWTQTIIL